MIKDPLQDTTLGRSLPTIDRSKCNRILACIMAATTGFTEAHWPIWVPECVLPINCQMVSQTIRIFNAHGLYARSNIHCNARWLAELNLRRIEIYYYTEL